MEAKPEENSEEMVRSPRGKSSCSPREKSPSRSSGSEGSENKHKSKDTHKRSKVDRTKANTVGPKRKAPAGTRIQELLVTFEKDVPDSPRSIVKAKRKLIIQQNEELRGQLEDLQKSFIALKEEYKAFVKERKPGASEECSGSESVGTEACSVELDQVQAQLESVQRERDNLKSTVQLLQEQSEKQHQFNESVLKEKDKAIKKKDKEVKKLMEEFKAMKEVGLEKSNEKVRSTAEETGDELSSLLEESEKKDSTISELRMMIDVQEEQVKNLKSELESLVETAEEIDKNLQKEKSQHRSTKEELEAMEQHCAMLENQLQVRSSPSSPRTDEEDNAPTRTATTIPVQTMKVKSLKEKGHRKSMMLRLPFSKKSKGNLSHGSLNVGAVPRVNSDRREVIAGPDAKHIAQPVDSQPKPMSSEQMRKELEVLILLGERLQEELQSEKKAHSATKELLSEQQIIIDELQENLIELRASSNDANSGSPTSGGPAGPHKRKKSLGKLINRSQKVAKDATPTKNEEPETEDSLLFRNSMPSLLIANSVNSTSTLLTPSTIPSSSQKPSSTSAPPQEIVASASAIRDITDDLITSLTPA